MFHTYLSSHYRQNIRLAINVLNASTQYLESRYLLLFQSFESIILTHKEKTIRPSFYVKASLNH